MSSWIVGTVKPTFTRPRTRETQEITCEFCGRTVTETRIRQRYPRRFCSSLCARRSAAAAEIRAVNGCDLA